MPNLSGSKWNLREGRNGPGRLTDDRLLERTTRIRQMMPADEVASRSSNAGFGGSGHFKSNPTLNEIKRSAESFDRPSFNERIFASVPQDVWQEMARAGISGKDREDRAVFCDRLLRQRKTPWHPNGKRVRLEDAGSIGVRRNAQILQRVFAVASGGPLHELVSGGLVRKDSG